MLTQQQPVNYLDGKDTAGSRPANTTVNDEFSNIQLPAGTATYCTAPSARLAYGGPRSCIRTASAAGRRRPGDKLG